MRVIVTASSRGIGFNVARELLKRNARVVISSRNSEHLKMAEKELAEFGEVQTVKANLYDQRELENLVKTSWELLDGIDALIWNAGNVRCEPCFLHEATYMDWLEAAALHSVAPGYLTTLLVQTWLEKKMKGTLVYLNSVSVKEPMPPLVLADVTRAGLIQLAKSVSRTYGKYGIRAYSVLLGSFDTPGARENLRKLAEERGEPFEETWEREVLSRTPLHRTGRWEELGSLVAFLLSEEAEYMLGSTVVIDGAMTRAVDI
ncbi:short-chain alcohol dehydrogenase [Thermococcus kodakarensis KOD1]|uniref:Short-chain alcohol dehydrogenase n=1 Tax=Thermococcus kodakarensis (strain ATCC BAA-918 / JCM 12380 / KOD1) TaxID=69014 RepID=Q5JF02_THEKO|nr:SDR family oxidoreductase [Thermococcus kodakarensis]WCN29204.1 SDR family oxidoreductase [Thermococcus kodakarensis]WCN31507.1 SDR family oxidoreductase [Thermococcus kodakarensis]BAD84862.1 short-chain alcohol dehydrogenase [Thermococcus kodakarensis KOD1]